MRKVLVVAAHPDDEILGVGATAAKHTASGDSVHLLILGEGQTSRWKDRESVSNEMIEQLHQDTLKAGKIIGYESIIFENLPDNRFDRPDLLDVVKHVERRVSEINPDIIYTHHYGDLNIDHNLTFKAVITAARPVNAYSVKEIYAFETVSSTEWNFIYGNETFKPNVFIDIEDYFDKKIEAMKCYQTELYEFPHPRSLKNLKVTAEKWGSVVGKNLIEAFELIRKVD